jgi:hypothetical protein
MPAFRRHDNNHGVSREAPVLPQQKPSRPQHKQNPPQQIQRRAQQKPNPAQQKPNAIFRHFNWLGRFRPILGPPVAYRPPTVASRPFPIGPAQAINSRDFCFLQVFFQKVGFPEAGAFSFPRNAGMTGDRSIRPRLVPTGACLHAGGARTNSSPRLQAADNFA